MTVKLYPTVVTDNLRYLPGSLPQGNVPKDVQPATIASDFVERLTRLEFQDLACDALWRDSFALSGTMRTFFSASAVITTWNELTAHHKPTCFTLDSASCCVDQAGQDSSWIEARFSFQTNGPLPSICSGFLSIVWDPILGWKIWVIRTILEKFLEFPSVDFLAHDQTPVAHTRPSAEETFNENDNLKKLHYECIVIGGGQSGLSTGGRLQALGIDYVVLEKQASVGDSWKSRYDAARLHGSRHFAHLPFEKTFNAEYPMFLGKDDLARGYQVWVKKYNINVWNSTTVNKGKWNDVDNRWDIQVSFGDREMWFTADHIVLAVGGGGQIPMMPQYPGRELFKGDVIHSKYFKSAAAWANKRGIVVGTANTGHDMAEDMLEHGMSVTMLQRSPTYVIPLEYMSPVMDALYNEQSDIELSDRKQFSTPAVVTRLRSSKMLHAKTRTNPERFDALERVGFQVNRFGDFFRHVNERQGGHYVDVGASAKIAQGLIKVKSNAQPVSYTPEGLLFSDGVELRADVIVFATGFSGNLRQVVADTFGHSVADQLEDFWGMDTEGETNGAFKPSGHPRLWYMGGGCGHSRYFSRFVALQVKAALVGKPLRVWKAEPKALGCR